MNVIYVQLNSNQRKDLPFTRERNIPRVSFMQLHVYPARKELIIRKVKDLVKQISVKRYIIINLGKLLLDLLRDAIYNLKHFLYLLVHVLCRCSHFAMR